MLFSANWNWILIIGITGCRVLLRQSGPASTENYREVVVNSAFNCRLGSVSRIAAIAGLLGIGLCASAQTFPSKQITVIAPTSPGGPVDITARIVAPELAKVLGQTVIVDNRPGASQKIGVHLMLRAPRDGYTVAVVSPASMTVNPLIDPDVGYDPLKDFTLLTYAADTASVVVVHPSVPMRSLRELITYAKANPGKLTYAGGAGTSRYFSTRELMMKLGITALEVPYKSDAPAFTDLLGGQINLMMAIVAQAKPMVTSGRLIGLAISSSERFDQLPTVPAYGELGIPELKDYTYKVWLGFAAAAGIPQEAATRLQESLIKVLRTPEIKESFTARGFQVVASTPQQFTTALRTELERNRKVIGSGGVKAD